MVRVNLLLAFACCWQALAGAPILRAAAPVAIRGEITYLQFTSDHKLLRRAADLASTGERYPEWHWTSGPVRNVPISHSSGTLVSAIAHITLAGAEPGSRFSLRGTSLEPGLCFRAEGALPRTALLSLELKAAANLGQAVGKTSARISWTLTLHPIGKPVAMIDLGATGPHVIYVTPGTPRHTDKPESAVTDVRLELAIARVVAARKAAGAEASGPRLVYELMQQNGKHYLPGRHYRGVAAWQVPQSWSMSPPGASCIGIVDFVRLVTDMVGIEGSARTSAICARLADPATAVRGGLGDPPEFKRGADGSRWQLFLVDHTNTNHGQAGGVGGVNYYEGTLHYTWNGKHYYYPGGTDRVYDHPDTVLRVFRTLAWAAYDKSRGDWVVREVVRTYVAGGEKFPSSVSLP